VKVETIDALKVALFTAPNYNKVHGLTGRDAQYKNPGVSIRSFIIANSMEDEFTVIPEALEEDFHECVNFMKTHKVSVEDEEQQEVAKLREALKSALRTISRQISPHYIEERDDLKEAAKLVNWN
jgi:hypothetical protein